MRSGVSPKSSSRPAGLAGEAFQKKEFEDDTIMDEFQIFRRALSPEEVHALFERGHITGRLAQGNDNRPWLQPPQREFATNVLSVTRISAPITVDGALDDWKNVPAHGGFIETRLGVPASHPGPGPGGGAGGALFFACRLRG